MSSHTVREVLLLGHSNILGNRKAVKSNSSYHWEMCRKTRKSVNGENKSSKSKYYCELIEERKGDSTEIWRAINAVSRNPKSSTPECIVSNGVQHTDPTAFNSFFASVDQTLADKFSYFCSKFSKSKEVQVGSFCLKEIDEPFVFKQLRSLKPKQSDWFGQNQCTAAEMCVFLDMFFSHQITKCLNFPISNQISQKSCSLPTL